jgi:transposase
MTLTARTPAFSSDLPAEEAALSYPQLHDQYTRLKNDHVQLHARVTELQRQLTWFQNQLFGRKSEQRFVDGESRQLSLGEGLESLPTTANVETIEVRYARTRGKQPLDNAVNEDGLRFDAQVPVKEIRLAPAEINNLTADQYDVIDEDVSHRLAQRPAAYVVIKYVRPVVKLKNATAEKTKIVTAAVPDAVLDKCYADVSLLAGMLVDKFVYHLPLYRIHQRMKEAGIALARGTLTTWVHRSIALLAPIHQAQLDSILNSRTLAMDETPIKAARKAPGQMGTGYFWPVYGDQDEVVFPFFNNRGSKNVEAILKNYGGVLLTDGYAAYDKYAQQVNTVTHAHCWAHARRMFLKAEDSQPQRTQTALDYIRLLYHHDAQLKERDLTDEKRLLHRTEHSKPVVEIFFVWLEQQLTERALLPQDPFTQAASYALQRKESLSVFLAYPDVPLDTNHLERALRVIPMGRKNWLFCWSETGAEYVGIVQSLLTTCKLHGVNPYDYLVDVLQRVGQHPASKVHELTPRLWKTLFAANPLRSVLHNA